MLFMIFDGLINVIFGNGIIFIQFHTAREKNNK